MGRNKPFRPDRLVSSILLFEPGMPPLQYNTIQYNELVINLHLVEYSWKIEEVQG